VPDDKHAAVFAIIDKIERMKPEEFAVKLEAVSGDATLADKVREAAGLGDLDSLVTRFALAGAGVTRVREVLAALTAFGLAAWVRLDLRIVRGLAYYTGVVFEAFARDEQGNLTGRAVAGGGRYDQLLNGLTGVDLPAAGFGMGDVVLGDLLAEKRLLSEGTGPRKLYVVRPDAALAAEGLALVHELRQAGFAVDYAMKFGSFGKQMQAAEDSGAVFAVIADSTLATNMVAVKRLATREQVTLPRAELVCYCRGE
jgi:histidyl-tRNA synthetase